MTETTDQKNVDHPFDKEDAVSLRHLFTSFCNNLALGQWELARAALRGLFRKRDELGKPVKEILRAIIDQPHACSAGSMTVPSPFHLSWLCLVEYLDLFREEEDQIPEPILKTVEFRLLLYVACKTAPQSVIQDLDDYHCQIAYRDPDVFASGASDLHSSTLNFIKELLKESPHFAYALITEISGRGKSFGKNNEILQKLYLDRIKELLYDSRPGSSRLDPSTSDNLNFAGEEEEFGRIYQLLSFMNPSSEMHKLSDLLDELFEDLIKRSSPGELSQHLDKGKLYSCLLGRSSTFLIEKFCRIENRMRFQPDLPMTSQSAQCVGCTAQICYSLSFVKDRKLAWQQLFFHSLEGNHILENIIETALSFVKDGDFDRVTQLLSPVEFARLKPLVVLLGWPYCFSCENARNLLEALWEPSIKAAHPILYQATQKLAYQVQLVQWCLQRAGPLLASSESGSTWHQHASDMFQGLESHSVLHVLHKSIKLALLPEKEVFDLLRRRPVFTLEEEDRPLSPFESQPTFFEVTAEGGDTFSDQEDLADGSQLYPEVARDMILYHSFCALRNFMASVTYTVEDLPRSGEEWSKCEAVDGQPSMNDHSFGRESSNASNLVSPSESVRRKSDMKDIKQLLEAGKSHLSHVYPLTYRVEVLENIFSLLFATYEDLSDGRTQHNESDGLDTNDEETRSLKSSLTGSMESLTSTDLSLDPSLVTSPLREQGVGASPRAPAVDSPQRQRDLQQSGASMDVSRRRQLFRGDTQQSESIEAERRAMNGGVQDRDGISFLKKARFGRAKPDHTSDGGFPRGTSRGGSEDEKSDEPRVGFVASDSVVPEFLKTLKDCLTELSTAKFSERRKEQSCVNHGIYWVRTSVQPNTIEQRVSRLGQFINEAQWRYQLVSWDEGPENGKHGRGMGPRKKARKFQQVLGDREEPGEESDCANSEETGGQITKPKTSPIEGKQEDLDEKSEDSCPSSTNLSQEITTSSESFGKVPLRRKKSNRARGVSRSSVSDGLLIRDGSSIARMLSSPSTLIYMCMRKDKFDRAYQVIKMFSMGDRPSAQAAIFAEKFDKVTKQLANLQPKGRRLSRPSSLQSRSGLGAVAMAAASGVSTSVVSGLIDELLTVPSLAAILHPAVNQEELANSKSGLTKLLLPDLVPAMVCLDLASTVTVPHQICRSLVDLAVKRLQGFAAASDGPLIGVEAFLNQLDKLLTQEQSRGLTTEKEPITISLTPKPSAVELLLSGSCPIRPKELQQHRKLVQDQELSLRRLETALEEAPTTICSVESFTSSESRGREASFKRTEKGLEVRVAMIEVQKWYDCVTNAGHVVTGAPAERFDYLRSLQKHVDTLATLLLFWRSSSAEIGAPVLGELDRNRANALKAANPFLVLNEGITETLGRPMFEKNVAPKRLETVAKQLHVNLVKVIVHNCCPDLSSRGCSSLSAASWPSLRPLVLNVGGRWKEKTREPNVVAKDLLAKMMNLLKGIAESNGGTVDPQSAVNAVRTPDFHAIVLGTEELQAVDLDLLHTNSEKVAFFTNVLNLLLAHASLVQFAEGSGIESGSRIVRHGSFTRLFDVSTASSDEPREGWSMYMTALERIAFLKQHGYSIGQLGSISAFDLQYLIVHAGLFPPSTFGSAIMMCYPEIPVDDPRRKYRPTAEKRAIFAICEGCVSSPDLEILDVSEIDAQLDAAVMSYIKSRVTLHQDTGQVVLPELLRWYRKDFEGPLNITDMHSSVATDPDVSLLLHLEPYMYSEMADKLHSMLSTIKGVTFSPFCWKFGYRFEVSASIRERFLSTGSSLPKAASVPDSLCLSSELCSVTQKRRRHAKYPLNGMILEYLEKTSPLVAALVTLVSPFLPNEDLAGQRRKSGSKSPQADGEELDAEKPDQTKAAKEEEDLPFKLVLQKLTKFPALQRYLVSKFYTLAEMVTLGSVDSVTSNEYAGSYEIIKLDAQIKNSLGIDISPEIPLFSLALASEGSRELQNAYLIGSDHRLRQGNFEDLMELISASDMHGDGRGGPPIDFLITSTVLSKGGKTSALAKKLQAVYREVGIPEFGFGHKRQAKPWTLLALVQDSEHLAQVVLSQLKGWRAKDSIDLLELCLSRPLENAALKKTLERKRKEVGLYQKISVCARSAQLQTTGQDAKPQSPSMLKQWQGVANVSSEDPERVMQFLLSVQQFEMAAEWAELQSLGRKFHQAIKESHLKYLLDNSPEEQMKAYRILESLNDEDMVLAICDSLLKQNLHVGQTLFIIQFMLTNLPAQLSPVRLEALLCTKMGAKALLCLPEAARPNYEHLVSRPPLLLEQLLMNMKVEWAAKVFQRIQVDLSCMEDSECVGDHGCTVAAFDNLLAKYASKALEFQVVQTETCQSKELSNSIMQSLTYASSTSPSQSSTLSGQVGPYSSGRITPLQSTPTKDRDRDSIAGSPEKRARERPAASRRIGSLERKTSTDSMFRRSVNVGDAHASFVPPAVTPRKDAWMPDDQVSACVICQEQFSMFNRRHHCRRCGRVVCKACSPHNRVVARYGNDPVRVCVTCYEYFYATRSYPISAESVETGRTASRTVPGSLERTQGSSLERGNTSASKDTHSLSSALNESFVEDLNVVCLWKFSLDYESNNSIRDEFYFEQAPSSSLCVSILDLHSDNKACGRLILDLCNTLSQKLVPVAPGVRNEEVDHNLIISMIRYLLFNAKLKMMKSGETQGVELCDTYLGHVDLMKFLVESNCGDIPSLQDLLRPDSARRMRDRFIESERLSLAMEVSTKCGLDPSGVWAAAGFAHLQTGDFATAREKFSRCMKASDGSKQQQQQSSQYLDKILNILQTSPLIAFPQTTDDLMAPLKGLSEFSKQSANSGVRIDSARFDECLYYLRNYGGPALLVSFYVRHGQVRLACRYILDKKCPVDVFVECFLMRLILKGNFPLAKEEMEAVEPTLQAWLPYLTGACRYLHRRGYHHLLHDLQLFMKDYFRAAQTCIKFFEGTAGGLVTSYENLYSRLHHLDEAKRHIEVVIAERRSPKGTAMRASATLRKRSLGKTLSVEDPSHLALSLTELTNHLNMITLQMEITNYMHRCTVEGGVTSLRAGDDGKLPTLFGNGHVRGELAVQVLLAGASVDDGFSLACRIVQDFNLPPSRVFVDTGRALARQYKFTHIRQLLRCVADTGLVTAKCHDDIILSCVKIVSIDQNQAKQVDSLIKLLKNDSNKIKAFVDCGKLKSAYLVAVKEERAEAIREIAEIALKTGQTKIVEICRKWLAQFQRKQEAQQRSASQRRRADDR